MGDLTQNTFDPKYLHASYALVFYEDSVAGFTIGPAAIDLATNYAWENRVVPRASLEGANR